MFALTYRLASLDSYRIKFDGVEIGSIATRHQHVQNRDVWHWGVDVMPLMDHGGRPPSGEAETFAGAKAAFKRAFEQWITRIPVEVWHLNRDHIKACDRWRR
jgi:hypothetical protein